MPTYRPKSTAPATFNLADAFAALITGDAVWGWLLDWIPLIGAIQYRTADFCAAGPDTATPLGILDFLPTRSRTGFGGAITDLQLAFKLKAVAHDRVFGAYCESVSAGGAIVCGAATRWTAANEVNVGSGNYQVSWGNHPIPAGSTELHATQIQGGHGWNDLHIDFSIGNTYVSSGGNLTSALNPGSVDVAQIPNGVDTVGIWSNGGNGAIYDIQFCGPGAGPPFVPADQPMPPGVIAPTKRVYNTIADLGAEMDRQELKLDMLADVVHFLTLNTVLPGVPTGDPVPAETGPIDLKDATGFVVTVSGIPAGADELFGTPPKYHRLGRVTIGNALGWLPAWDLSENPMLVAPLPAGATRCQVVVNAPATATVQILRPPK